MRDKAQNRALILDALADLVGNNIGGKSIALEMEGGRMPSDARPRFAHEWARLFSLIPGRPMSAADVRSSLTQLFDC